MKRETQSITVTDLRTRLGQVRRRLRQAKNLIITSHGKPIALMCYASEADVESLLAALRRARALVAMPQMREAVRASDLDQLSLDEIDAEIQSVRQDRYEPSSSPEFPQETL